MSEAPLENIRVFISSTADDLVSYRQAVFSAVQELGGSGEDMVYWSADERRPVDVCLRRVRGADLLVLIVAYRYGYVPEDSEYSMTELEYRAAEDAQIPVLAFFIDPDVPWPPKFIERERVAELEKFKKRVMKSVVCRTFKSPDELKSNLVVALTAFAIRYRTEVKSSQRFNVRTERVNPTAELRVQPNVTLEIGRSPEQLPLLLSIQRSVDIQELLGEFKSKLEHSGADLPEAVLEEFRRIIEAHCVEAWTNRRIFKIRMQDRTMREMYVTSQTLSQLFKPVLSRILQFNRKDPRRATQGARRGTLVASRGIESVGGKNRFLGISLWDGKIFSVGRSDNDWVEWRPFLYENLQSNFPDAAYDIAAPGTRLRGKLNGLSDTLQRLALKYSESDGTFRCSGTIDISRQAVGILLAEIGSRVAALNADGKIHGDIKPENILITGDGPVPVDSFDILENTVAPGWTPDWAAPEQLLGMPLSAAADVYPLGRMVAQLLQAHLVGEVRKFRAPNLSNDGYDEFDLFYDPMVTVERGHAVPDMKNLGRWLDFARDCLRFDPQTRINSPALFTKILRTLLVECPLSGVISLRLPQVVATKWINGSESVAVRLADDLTTEEYSAEHYAKEGARPALQDVPGHATKCAQGHTIDPSWRTCPYCEAEQRSSKPHPGFEPSSST
jgi:hypothetical protein